MAPRLVDTEGNEIEKGLVEGQEAQLVAGPDGIVRLVVTPPPAPAEEEAPPAAPAPASMTDAELEAELERRRAAQQGQ